MKWILSLVAVLGFACVTFAADPQSCTIGPDGKAVCKPTSFATPVRTVLSEAVPRTRQFVSTVVQSRPRLFTGRMLNRFAQLRAFCR